MAKWRLSAIQLTSTPQPEQNLAQVQLYLQQLSEQFGNNLPHLVALPECFAVFGGGDGLQLQHQAPLGLGDIQQRCAALAQQFGVYLLAGSLPTSSPQPERFSASSILFAPDGSIVADYQKMHLFDVEVSDGTGSYRESASTCPGQKISLATVGELKLGLSVFYDVRFPALMQALAAKGMNVLTVPSAFTRVTGAAHWHTLLKARAIENQSYFLASAQSGQHTNGRSTWGQSMLIDPWGEVQAELKEGEGFVIGNLDKSKIQEIRAKLPSLQHRIL